MAVPVVSSNWHFIFKEVGNCGWGVLHSHTSSKLFPQLHNVLSFINPPVSTVMALVRLSL